jgi:hypothetical protein
VHIDEGVLHRDLALNSVALETYQNAASGSSILMFRRPLSTNSTYLGGLLIAKQVLKRKWNLLPMIHWGQRWGYAQWKGMIR